MNIVYAITRNVYEKLLPSITSLAEHNPDANVFILCEDDVFPFELPIKANIVNISDQTFFPNIAENRTKSFGGYINHLKVYYPTFLPVDKVIHLDMDTIICDKLDGLWETDVEGKWFAAVPETQIWYKPYGDKYYNLGVALINLKQMRADGIEKMLGDFLLKKEPRFADQNAWNKFGLERGMIAPLDLRYNESKVTGYTDNPAVVHYCAIDDWWNNKKMKRVEYLNLYKGLPLKRNPAVNQIRYMIHAIPKRMWYVENFLLPELRRQGVKDEEVKLWVDEEGWGNLESFVRSMQWVMNNCMPSETIWHLQDDVWPHSRFVEMTSKINDVFAWGFALPEWNQDHLYHTGFVPLTQSWTSFQANAFPNRMAAEFVVWFRDAKRTRRVARYANDGKHDDVIWRQFLDDVHPNDRVYNCNPNVVDHVDYLMGGTSINPSYPKDIKRNAYWWDEPERTAELEERVKKWKQEN